MILRAKGLVVSLLVILGLAWYSPDSAIPVMIVLFFNSVFTGASSGFATENLVLED